MLCKQIKPVHLSCTLSVSKQYSLSVSKKEGERTTERHLITTHNWVWCPDSLLRFNNLTVGEAVTRAPCGTLLGNVKIKSNGEIELCWNPTATLLMMQKHEQIGKEGSQESQGSVTLTCQYLTWAWTLLANRAPRMNRLTGSNQMYQVNACPTVQESGIYCLILTSTEWPL